MSVPYLISRAIDPFFATGIGIAAAAVRINREEKEKGKSTQEIIESLKRRTAMIWGNDSANVKKLSGNKGS